jgi:hypothetical protein
MIFNLASILMSSVLIIGSTAIGNPNALNDRQLRDRMVITDVVNSVGTFADLRQWSQLQQLFADEVRVDYTSLFGGEVQNISSQQLMSQWQSVLPGFDATQHLISNHQITIDGDKATVIAYVRATHKLGDRMWVVGGYYVDKLVKTDDGWKVTAIQYNALYEEGDRSLVEQAAAKVANQTNTDK